MPNRNINFLDARLNEFGILVVDDTPANLEVIIETLSSANYDISAVTSGKRALKQLQHETPSLILLDIQMPEMDGFETCEKIKANPITAGIPIIFITALSDAENIVQGLALGAVDYITKPFKEKELLARVQTHLKLHVLTEKLEQQVDNRTAELQIALEQVRQSKLQLVQHEKMSALGNLVAGVAHEVNNPLGFLNGSIHNAQEYVQDFFDYLHLYQQNHPPVSPDLQEKAEEIDLEYLLADFPKLLNSMQTASDRIRKISTSLRTFSRADTQHKTQANFHEGIDSTLIILKYRLKANEYRPAIQVVKEYGDLPLVHCFLGQLNQVFMNILANAIDMFDEIALQVDFEYLKTNPQIITIQTEHNHEKKYVDIRIEDNGKGMPPEVREKAFEYLFTTKAVGKGTGLGLALAHQIMSEKHGGSLSIQSELGTGTEFIMCLPV